MESKGKSSSIKAKEEIRSNARELPREDSDREKSQKQEVQQSSVQEGKKVSYRERKEKLLNFLQQAGSWILPRAIADQIALECNVSERQIYKDRLKIIRSIPKPDVNEVAGKFLINWDFAMLQAISLMRSDDSMIKAKGVDLYFKSIDVFTRFMENFGLKQKVPDKIEHQIKQVVINIVKPEEEIYEMKSPKKNGA